MRLCTSNLGISRHTLVNGIAVLIIIYLVITTYGMENSLPSSSTGGTPAMCCRLPLRSAAVACTFAQIGLTLSLSIFMHICLPHSVIVSILIAVSLFCCSVAILFSFICIGGRKFGSLYDIFLHGYLLSMLLMALTSFFEVMYFPLSMIQSFTSWTSPLITYYSVSIVLSALTLFFQFFQRSIVEEMLPHMQYSFK